MNAAKPGLNVGSTRPLSRAERRAEAARVHNETEPKTAAETPAPEIAAPPAAAGSAPAPVVLPTRQKSRKRPFSTQLHAATLARLEWTLKRHDTALTDIADAAINAYLDSAGVPHPDMNGVMPE